MNVVLRGIRVVDPSTGMDRQGCDVWVRDGRLVAIERRLEAPGAVVLDCRRRSSPLLVAPAFVDLHAHLRDPGMPDAETVESGAAAAARGGFAQVVAMANTRPPIDNPRAVGRARAKAGRQVVHILPAAALTVGLRGEELVDIPGCAAAGAACFSDDGRNAFPRRLLVEGLWKAAEVGRAVFVHPEDEQAIAAANPGVPSVVRCPLRPATAEVAAVEAAIQALASAGRGRLHLQHLSCAASLEPLQRAKEMGLEVTAEVTPHHLAMWLPMAEEPDPPALRKVNPPLRTQRDREALIQALREGLVDAVATDHAPHPKEAKDGEYADAAPGMVGLETAFAVCATFGGMGGDWLPVLVERLTTGPWRAAGEASGVRRPALGIGEPATLVLLDPEAEWQIGADEWASRSRNTPLWGVSVRGRVLLTLVDGQVAYCAEPLRSTPLGEALGVAARVSSGRADDGGDGVRGEAVPVAGAPRVFDAGSNPRG